MKDKAVVTLPGAQSVTPRPCPDVLPHPPSHRTASYYRRPTAARRAPLKPDRPELHRSPDPSHRSYRFRRRQCPPNRPATVGPYWADRVNPKVLLPFRKLILVEQYLFRFRFDTLPAVDGILLSLLSSRIVKIVVIASRDGKVRFLNAAQDLILRAYSAGFGGAITSSVYRFSASRYSITFGSVFSRSQKYGSARVSPCIRTSAGTSLATGGRLISSSLLCRGKVRRSIWRKFSVTWAAALSLWASVPLPQSKTRGRQSEIV